ncbi:MAG: hypothetical protein LBD41_00575, partial [Clostridiales Family XIII bacterium]|nr:hypothetical protein [Clostridiales Family XIII bacterium]
MSKLYEHVYTGIKVEIADDQMLTHPFRLISSDNKAEKSVKTQENIKKDESEKIKEPKVIGSSKNEWIEYA